MNHSHQLFFVGGTAFPRPSPEGPPVVLGQFPPGPGWLDWGLPLPPDP